MLNADPCLLTPGPWPLVLNPANRAAGGCLVEGRGHRTVEILDGLGKSDRLRVGWACGASADYHRITSGAATCQPGHGFGAAAVDTQNKLVSY